MAAPACVIGVREHHRSIGVLLRHARGAQVAHVRALTRAPILIAETGATAAAGQPAKIADVFAGIHAYGLLGLVWYDSTDKTRQDFSITSAAALTAFGHGASTFTRPGS